MSSRVAMVVHHYFPRDVRVRREARALAAAGLDVNVIALQRPGEARRERWRDIGIVRIPVRRHRGSSLPVYLAEYAAFTAAAALALGNLLREGRFVVVHVHTPPDFLAAAGLPAIVAGARLVLDVHDLTPELYGSRFSGYGGALARRVVSGVERAACALADRVITVTGAFERRLTARGISAEKILVLHNCPDEEIFGGPTARRSKSSRSKIRPFVIVHHGTLVRRYGADLLLDAFCRVVTRLPQARLEIFGEGDLVPELTRRVGEAPLRSRVVLYGDRPQEEVARALGRADLCLVPNRSDGFTDLLLPTKLLEALQMGCPVIASATPVIAETFGGGGVRLVPPGDVKALADAILELAASERERRSLAAAGNEQVKRFCWRTEKEKLLGLYKELGCQVPSGVRGGTA